MTERHSVIGEEMPERSSLERKRFKIRPKKWANPLQLLCFEGGDDAKSNANSCSANSGRCLLAGELQLSLVCQ